MDFYLNQHGGVLIKMLESIYNNLFLILYLNKLNNLLKMNRNIKYLY